MIITQRLPTLVVIRLRTGLGKVGVSERATCGRRRTVNRIRISDNDPMALSWFARRRGTTDLSGEVEERFITMPGNNLDYSLLNIMS